MRPAAPTTLPRRLALYALVVGVLLTSASHAAHATPAALVKAAARGDVKKVEALLDRGTRVDARDADAQTALHAAASRGNLDLIRLLAKRGAKLEARDSDGRTPLHHATDRQALAALLMLGAKVNAKATSGDTALHLAARSNRYWLTRILLAVRADPNLRNASGRSPLHAASTHLYTTESLVMLLLAGAETSARDHAGHTPLAVALRAGNSWATKHLLKAAKPQSAFTAAGAGDLATLRRYLAASPSPRHARTKEGATLLHWAALDDSGKAIKALVTERVDIDAADDRGQTALHWAAAADATASVRALLERGAEPGARDAEGLTPLHIAAMGHHESVARALVRAGADLAAKTPHGKTAFNLVTREEEDDSLYFFLAGRD